MSKANGLFLFIQPFCVVSLAECFLCYVSQLH